ncbi:unnamed protein product, partial [Prorocentrum cordatum]
MEALPAPLASGVAFLSAGARAAVAPIPAAEPRSRSALHGRRLSPAARALAQKQARLPAAAQWVAIADSLRRMPVTVLSGETGSGKSTQVPQIALDVLRTSSSDDGWRVVILMPGVDAAELLYRRLGAELGAPQGLRLCTGRDGPSGPPDSRLAIMTYGSFLAQEELWAEVGVLIMDETHEREAVMSELQMLMRPLALSGQLRLVLMSATLCRDPMATFFGPDHVCFLDVEGREHELHQFALDRSPAEDADDEELRAQAEEVVIAEASLGLGGILCFFAGQQHIGKTARNLRRALPGWTVLEMYSRAPPAMKREVYDLQRSSARVALLTTSALGSSVTLERFVSVVSTCRRNAAARGSGGVSAMETQWASRQCVIQQGGRAGRTRPGRHLPLCRTDELAPRREAGVHVESLDKLVLRLIDRRQWAAAQDLVWMPGESPDAESLRDAFLLADDAGFVDDARGRAPKLSRMGEEILRLPLAPQNAHLVAAAVARGVGSEGARVAAVLEAARQGGFSVDPELGRTEAFARLAATFSGAGDLGALLGVAAGFAAQEKSQRGTFAEQLNVREDVLQRSEATFQKVLAFYDRAGRPLRNAEGCDNLGVFAATLVSDPQSAPIAREGPVRALEPGGGRRGGHDAKASLYFPVPPVLLGRCDLGDVLVLSDSLLRLGAHAWWPRARLCRELRERGALTVHFEGKGGMRAREMADLVQRAAEAKGDSFDTFVGSLQVNDLAWVDKAGAPHVWSASPEFERTRGACAADLGQLACALRAHCRRATLVVSDCLYPARAQDPEIRERYEAAARFTRKALGDAGIFVVTGEEELCAIPLAGDGVHFERSAAVALARACAGWAAAAQAPLPPPLQEGAEEPPPPTHEVPESPTPPAAWLLELADARAGRGVAVASAAASRGQLGAGVGRAGCGVAVASAAASRSRLGVGVARAGCRVAVASAAASRDRLGVGVARARCGVAVASAAASRGRFGAGVARAGCRVAVASAIASRGRLGVGVARAGCSVTVASAATCRGRLGVGVARAGCRVTVAYVATSRDRLGVGVDVTGSLRLDLYAHAPAIGTPGVELRIW